MSNTPTLWLFAGVILLGFGAYYFITGHAVVGIKGMTRTLHGIGARIVGSIYILVALILFATVATSPLSTTSVAFGGVLAVLIVSIIGYFFAGDS